jgi:outer membrane protein OmpA-like peptidoglycan-associated protein
MLALSPAHATTPFLLFFDTGSTALNGYGTAVLDNAAAAYRQVDARLLIVQGHADRVGSEADNLLLSQRRAEVVRAALVRRGVPAERIRIEALGEGRPQVETADGVAEAQNRYAWVIMREMCNSPLGAARPDIC